MLNHYYYDESGNLRKSGVVEVDENGYITVPLGYGTANAFAEAAPAESAEGQSNTLYWLLIFPVIIAVGYYMQRTRGI